MVFNVLPVAVLGLAFYVFAVVIFSPWAWQFRGSRALRISSRGVDVVRLGSVIVGMGFVMYLIYAEFQIGSICEYCTRRPHRHVPAVLHHRCQRRPLGTRQAEHLRRPLLTAPPHRRSRLLDVGRLSRITLCSCSPARPGRGRFPP